MDELKGLERKMEELVCLVYSMKENRQYEDELVFSILNEKD
jgi:hypothetical protein